ncbi:TonB-dependent receptor [Rapidithrix thailandica]|uniref:TonB-dependent receptor n=1 Tax=Rapidithrix thailandica TaxID=413964 RepID=A0AAW9RU16_9BACT
MKNLQLQVGLFLYFMMLSVLGNGQVTSTRKVQGKVVDQITSEPLPGTSVQLLGLNQGTITDADGYFLFNNIVTGQIKIQVRYMGYKTKTVDFDLFQNSSEIVIELEEDVLGLEEVVISGQGIDVEKRRLSTNVSSMSSEEIERVPSQRIDQLLQSAVPNLQIKMTGGQPGSTSLARARGIVSAFVNSTPIVYVDGVRIDNLNTAPELGLVTSGSRHQGAATSALADIPVENIEKIEFINGGAATTLYGSDAANGVIQIFTKKGGEGKAKVTFETQWGVEKANTDFYYFDRTDELFFESGLMQKHRMGINGGSENFGYSLSGSIFHTDGTRIHKQNENTRYDLRSSFRAELGKKATYHSSFGYTSNQFNRVRNGNAGGYTGLWFTEGGASLFTGPGFNNKIDELSQEEFDVMKAYVDKAEALQNFQTNVNRFQTSQSIILKPVKNLTIKALAGVDYRVQKETGITTNEYLNHTRAAKPGSETTTEGSISNYDRKFLGLTLELTGQYNLQVGDFSFLSTGGGQLFRNEDHQSAYIGTNLRDGAQTISGAANLTSDEYYSEVANYGLYFQESIGFKDRYFFEFGLRGDRNSAFGDNIGTQFFPKVGASYVLSDEAFFEGLKEAVSYVKVRANYGVAGNFPTPFAHQRTIAFAGFRNEQAATFGQAGNADLKPERVKTFEVGADLAFVRDRISLGVNYYQSNTVDALFVVPAAPSTGQNEQLRNIGKIENKGWEISTRIAVLQNKDWKVNVRAAVNTLKNKVTDAGGAAPFNINGFSPRTIQTVVEEGQPVGYLRGNKGTFSSEGVMTGTEAQANLGTTLPDLFGNLGVDIQFKRLSVFANADYQAGAYAHSFDRQFRFNYQVSNEGIPQAEIDANGRKNWLNFTDRFVEKTDFLKVRIIGANYTFPKTVLGNYFEQVNLGVSVTNPFNFTSSSFDPEVSQSGGSQGQNGASTGGIAYGVVSSPRQFIATLKVSF